MNLTSAQSDRAAGAMLGMAAGDALGAGYEFGPAFTGVVSMKGGGGYDWAPGEWTDDTSMAIPIVRALAAGRDLRDESVQDDIVAAWVQWAKTAPDVGIQLGQRLSSSPSALVIHVEGSPGRSGGGSILLCAAPVSLGHFFDENARLTKGGQLTASPLDQLNLPSPRCLGTEVRPLR